MNIKDLFHFNIPFLRIKLDNGKEENISEKENYSSVNSLEELPKDIKNEWNQEYEMIYLSYVLEK